MFGGGLLLYASWSDLKTRRVTNILWAEVIFFGMLFMGGDMIGRGEYAELLILVPIATIGMIMFFEGGKRTNLKENQIATPIWIVMFIASIASVAGLRMMIDDVWDFFELAQIPLLMLVFFGMWAVGFFGGGDAKCLMSMAVLVPGHLLSSELPRFGTENPAFPFVVTMLMNAAILFAFYPVCLFFVNLARRKFGLPEMFLGLRMPLEKAKKSFMWPMERIVDGQHALFLFPSKKMDIKKELRLLEKEGIDEIWVSPKIPFVIGLTAGFIVAGLFGDIIWTLMMNLVG